jgi:hypothetical protein
VTDGWVSREEQLPWVSLAQAPVVIAVLDTTEEDEVSIPFTALT